jgi:hypothetical protein
LEQVSRQRQITFGLGCCERLYLAYAHVAAKENMPDVLRPILDQLWEHLEGAPKSVDDLVTLRKRAAVARETLREETADSEYRAISNCMDATYRASSSCLDNTVDNVMWAWTWCEDVVYQFLWDPIQRSFDGVVPHERVPELHAIILANPLMIREYQFALSLLSLLREHRIITQDVRDAVTRLAQTGATIP